VVTLRPFAHLPIRQRTRNRSEKEDAFIPATQWLKGKAITSEQSRAGLPAAA